MRRTAIWLPKQQTKDKLLPIKTDLIISLDVSIKGAEQQRQHNQNEAICFGEHKIRVHRVVALLCETPRFDSHFGVVFGWRGGIQHRFHNPSSANQQLPDKNERKQQPIVEIAQLLLLLFLRVLFSSEKIHRFSVSKLNRFHDHYTKADCMSEWKGKYTNTTILQQKSINFLVFVKKITISDASNTNANEVQNIASTPTIRIIPSDWWPLTLRKYILPTSRSRIANANRLNTMLSARNM